MKCLLEFYEVEEGGFYLGVRELGVPDGRELELDSNAYPELASYLGWNGSMGQYGKAGQFLMDLSPHEFHMTEELWEELDSYN